MALKSSSPEQSVSPPGGAVQKVRVWDLPLRLFHWLLVVCVVGAIGSAKAGNLNLHFWFGYGVLALLIFRILWGLVGPRYARFTSFVFSPATLLRYLRGTPDAPRTLGHSPLGALSVFAMLAILASQAGSGLFVSDEIAFEGPLAHQVSAAAVDTASWWHRLNERFIFAIIGLHLAAILYYRVFQRKSLVKPMVVGDRLVAPTAADPVPDALASRDDAGVRLRALVIAAIAAGIVATIVNAG
jgi:cytochrome b